MEGLSVASMRLVCPFNLIILFIESVYIGKIHQELDPILEIF